MTRLACVLALSLLVALPPTMAQSASRYEACRRVGMLGAMIVAFRDWGHRADQAATVLRPYFEDAILGVPALRDHYEYFTGWVSKMYPPSAISALPAIQLLAEECDMIIQRSIRERQ